MIIYLMRPSIYPTIVNLCLKSFQHLRFKLMIKWIKKVKKKSFSALKLNKNNSKLWFHKKEESTSLLVTKLFSSMLIHNTTWVVRLTVQLRVSELSKLNSEKNFQKRMYSCFDLTELIKKKAIKSVLMLHSEFIIARLNVMYLIVLKECLSISNFLLKWASKKILMKDSCSIQK